MKKALILVDFENEWLDKRSDYYMGDISEILEKTNHLINLCRKRGHKIIFIRHVEKDSDKEFAENSKNTGIIPSINKADSDIIITKNKISPFYETNLEEELEGMNEIVVCGILTNLCVRSLVQDAYDRDFEIEIIGDCCVAFDKETHDFTLKDLKSTREEIKILNLEEFKKNQ